MRIHLFQTGRLSMTMDFILNNKHLKDIKNKNPKEYWKVINKCNKNKNCQNQSAIGIDDLYQYFRDLNRSPEISGENDHMVDNEIANLQYEDFNHDLNNYITQDEIKKSIKNLKNNNANGEDGIRNEYILKQLSS